MNKNNRQEASTEKRSATLWVGLASLGVLVLALVVWGIFQLSSGSVFRQISATEAHKLILEHESDPDFIVLDVRAPEEFALGHLPAKTLINLNFYAPDFREKLTQLDRRKTYLVYCRTGNRSHEVVRMMQELGFQRVYDLQGGITAWRRAGLPVKIEK